MKKMFLSIPLLFLTVACFFSVCVAVAEKAAAMTQESPFTPMRIIAFTATEGTHISVDVSPDGKTLVFDLLGQIYELPLSGGKARALTHGPAWSRLPRYSPDGKHIAMIRDGEGQNEIWLIPAAGGTPRQLTSTPSIEGSHVRGNPAWTADGKRMVFSRLVNALEFYQHDLVTGLTSELLKLDKSQGLSAGVRPSASFEAAPVLSPDGRELYVAEMLRLGKKKPPRPGRVVVRYRLDSGERTALTEIKEDICASTPQLTRNTRQLVYLSGPCVGVPSLYVRDLQTGSKRKLLTFPASEARAFTPNRPGSVSHSAYSFTPDGKFVVISFDGRIYKVPMKGGEPLLIPFTVDVSRKIAPLAHARTSLTDGPVEVRAISWPRLTLDGKRLVFSALGHLWIQELSGGAPKRLTNSDGGHFEYMPALSPDGKQVAYIDFQRVGRKAGPGRLMVVPLSGGAPKAVVSEAQGESTYLHPTWSADSKKLAFVRAEAKSGARTGTSFGWVALGESKPHVLVRHELRDARLPWSRLVWFSKEGTHLLYQIAPGDGANADAKLRSIPLEGGVSRLLVHIAQDTVGMMPSPDGRQLLALGLDQELWLRSLPVPGASAATLNTHFDDVELRRITLTGAEYVDWQPDRSFIYNFGNKIYRYRIGQNKPKLIHTIRLAVPRHRGEGITAFTNARIITMSGGSGAGEVIENGTLVVQGRRIVAVGLDENVAAPKGARVIDATGLTLMPGLGDMHAHSTSDQEYRSGFMQDDDTLGLPGSIAYGVTFVWEPTSVHFGMPALTELHEAGRISGPKWLYGNPTGRIENARSQRMMNSYDDVLRSFEHKRDLGGTIVKEYETPRRDRRRWLGEAARELGLGVASHVSSSLPWALSLVAEGYTGFDHSVELRPLREDARQYLARTGVIWTPNIINSTWSYTVGQNYRQEVVRRWPEQREKFSVYASEKHRALDRFSADPGANPFVYQVRDLASWMASGVKIGIASHGTSSNDPNDSIKPHGDMWMLQQAGAPVGAVLRAGTMIPAEKMGLEKELGSLEVGKVADILVLKANPLDDVMNTIAIRYVMADGVLYDPMAVGGRSDRNGDIPH